MPTNFHVSLQPVLRCVTGEPYQLPMPNPAAGFFTRLRMAERLVIQQGAWPTFGPEPRVGLPVGDLPAGPARFARKTSHA